MTAETTPHARAVRAASAAHIRARPRIHTWADQYKRRLLVTDVVVVIAAVTTAQLVRFGLDLDVPVASMRLPAFGVSAAICGVWVALLLVTRVADTRVVGAGTAEFTRLVRASVTLFGLLAIVDLLLRLNTARGYIALALPVGTAGLLASHRVWRWVLASERRRGNWLNHVLVIGSERSARPLIARLSRMPQLGFRVVGVCLPHARERLSDERRSSSRRAPTLGEQQIPVFGDFSDARGAVLASGATTVAVTSAETLGHSAMRELSWELEGMHVDMVVDPGLIDVAGPRMVVRPVAGLPLLHIEKPTYRGATRIMKATLDRLGACLALLAMSPVLVACAVAVKADSPGPVFYTATRIGLGNKPFRMWKFRSMVADADRSLSELTARNEGAGLLFKMRDDPRVTRIGRVMRRYSLDELPQLFNVVGGSMSLVGPRPPLAREVSQYSGEVRRRMLVKPGITGLWQVSGRSDLNWEESVRLDLTYVENWSLAQDLAIIWRTVRTVTSARGAY